MWLAATHYFESEIINKLITHIKIHQEAIKSKTLGGNIVIKCSLFIAFDSLYTCTVQKLQNPEYIKLQQQQSAGMPFN